MSNANDRQQQLLSLINSKGMLLSLIHISVLDNTATIAWKKEKARVVTLNPRKLLPPMAWAANPIQPRPAIIFLEKAERYPIVI